MKETYVKILREWKTSGAPDVYSPIDLETRTIYLGLTLIGSIPDGAKLVGEFEEKTGKLTLVDEAAKGES
jgi:hypothetical protein